jgi:O-antigen/teichoic acid export membrane protein
VVDAKTTANAAWLVGCRVTGDVVAFALFVAISRHFGPAGIGAYSYGFAVATLGYYVSALGIDDYGVREYVRLPRSEGVRLIAELLGAQWVVIAATVAAFALYLWATGELRGEVATIVALLSSYQFAFALTRTLFIPAMGQQEMIAPAVIELACRAFAVVLAFVLIMLLRATLAESLVGYAIGAVILIAASAWSARRHVGSVRVGSSWRGTLERIRLLWSFATAAALVQVFARVGLIVLTLAAGAAVAGIYATGLKFVEVALVPLFFSGFALYPALSRLSVSDPRGFLHASMRFLFAWELMSGLTAWALYFAIPPLLEPLLGDRFVATAPVLRLMIPLAMMQAAEQALMRLLLVSDLQLPRLRLVALATLLNLLLAVALVPRWGITGAVVAGTLACAALVGGYVLVLPAAVRKLVMRSTLVLAVSLALAAGAAWYARYAGLTYWLTAIAAGCCFLASLAVLHGISQPALPQPGRALVGARARTRN